MINRSNDKGRSVIRSLILLMSLMVALTLDTNVVGAGGDHSAITRQGGVGYEGLKLATYNFLDGAFRQPTTSVAFNGLPSVWRRRCFIMIIGILGLLAIVTFERYRAARIK